MQSITADEPYVGFDTDIGLTSQTSFEGGLRGLLCANLADGFFTLGWIYTGLALEANPVMEEALRQGPGHFILFKVALVCLASTLLWRNRNEYTARIALIPAVVLYAYVMGGHVGFAIGNLLDVIPTVM